MPHTVLWKKKPLWGKVKGREVKLLLCQWAGDGQNKTGGYRSEGTKRSMGYMAAWHDTGRQKPSCRTKVVAGEAASSSAKT